MISKEAYESFEAVFRPIVEDTICNDPDETLLEQGVYFIRKGLMEATEEHIYVYDKRKILPHKKALLQLCRSLPKRRGPSEQSGGIISCEDLFVDTRKYPEGEKIDGYLMFLLANHFANLLEFAAIAKPYPQVFRERRVFILALNPKYGAYINGQSDEIPE